MADTATWLVAALDRAKRSALPDTLAVLLGRDPDDPAANAALVVDAIDAIEGTLLTVTGVPTETTLRTALRPVVEPYAAELDLPWEVIADAILAALDGAPATPAHTLGDTWQRR